PPPARRGGLHRGSTRRASDGRSRRLYAGGGGDRPEPPVRASDVPPGLRALPAPATPPPDPLVAPGRGGAGLRLRGAARSVRSPAAPTGVPRSDARRGRHL